MKKIKELWMKLNNWSQEQVNPDDAEILKAMEELNPKTFEDFDDNFDEWSGKVIELLKKNFRSSFYEKFFYELTIYKYSGPQEKNQKISNMINIYWRALSNQQNKLRTHPQKHFESNKPLDIKRYLRARISQTEKSIYIVDNYLNHLIVDMISDSKATKIKILTKKPKKSFLESVMDFKKQHSETKTISVKKSNDLHSRYIIIDNKKVWSLSCSLDDHLGKKPIEIDERNLEDSKKIIKKFKKLWDESKALSIPK